jgi:hypothetical protein
VNNEYVIIRLGSGEQLMALKTAESDRTITLVYPMQIKMYPRQREDGTITETVAGAPFCHFADEKIFTINKDFVVFENNLHPKLVQLYTDMVDQYEAQENEHDGAPQTEEVDPIEKLFSMLDILKRSEEKNEAEELLKKFVEGNDTVH